MLIDGITMTATGSIKETSGEPYLGAAVYDIAGSTLSQPTDGAVIMRFQANRAFRLPTGLTDSAGGCDIAATAQADYDIQKNGGSIGTMTWAAAATDATFTFSTQIDFASGDTLTVVAPATADATHDGLQFTFAGNIDI